MSFVPGDIHDIRGPIAIDAWWRWPLAIALSAAAALVVVTLLRWLKTRRKREPSPLERARAALRIAEGHAEAGRAHEWAIVVAPVVREAVAARLGTAVLPETTAELSARLWVEWTYEGPVTPSEGGARPIDAPRIISLLELCDIARFARATVEPTALVSETASALALVEALHAPIASRSPRAHEQRNITGIAGAVSS